MREKTTEDSLLTRCGFVLLLLAGVKPARMDAELPAEPTASTLERSGAWENRLAAQDWLLVTYLLVLLGQCLQGHGARRPLAIRYVLFDLAAWLAVLAVTRSDLLARRPRLRSAIYRAGIGLPVLGSFLQLQYILPTAGHPPLDAQLHALDLRVFGVEPSEAWDRFVSPATTEWFAFFYYGYFFLIAVHVLPMLGFVRSSPLLARFSFGFIWLYCVGQALYTFVPAYGPYAYLGHDFKHALVGDLWWPLVQRAVSSVDGGARTDVFPSLHTAMPTYLSLFSFSERRRMPFRLTWLPLSLFTSQIIAATMFLRWHYLVDICAGITLAVSGMLASRLAFRWDERRVASGGSPVWLG
ncbi:MAG: phosphoesterase, PA-phosphatase related protein [Labilithrix sp.]|nr:phosphoesterase, PA-phosphatase related protein [Labilithrix sp.]